jgi:hypothetical protein
MTAVTTWRYQLPNENGEGWAIVFMDSIGCFSVLSDYGDYGYRWPQAGWGPGDFRKFILGCDDHYLLRKIARRDHYDGDKTLRAIKKRILRWRREGMLRKDQARQEWDLVTDRYGSVYSREDFAIWYQRTHLESAHELAVYDFEPSVLAFVKHVLPRLRAKIREDIGT